MSPSKSSALLHRLSWKRFPLSLAILLTTATLPIQADSGGRPQVLASVDQNADAYWEAAMDLWNWAEPGYKETRSSARLAAMLLSSGFRIQEGVSGIPTAFVAESGSGSPIIGILGEFDALPGLSQTAAPRKEARKDGNGYGHACGHHLFGVASAAAAIAIATSLQTSGDPGTVRFYGTPAEEGGAAKVFMTRDGLFADCDAVLHWHPSSMTAAGDPTCLARVAAKFRFKGISSHAAVAPERGRSALDAVELMNHASELMREHTPDFTRIHHVITAGGLAPNVVPDFAEAYYYIRHPDAAVVQELYQRLIKCAQAGALATETELSVEFLGGTHNVMPNDTLAQITMKNLRELANLRYTKEERAFAEELSGTLLEPENLDELEQVFDRSGEVTKGSTDVGDVSWVVPTTGLRTATWTPGTPPHSWQAVACGATGMARKGMLLAARTLAVTGWDLIHDVKTLEAARKELLHRLEGRAYKAMLDDGQAPPLDYRDPPKGLGESSPTQ